MDLRKIILLFAVSFFMQNLSSVVGSAALTEKPKPATLKEEFSEEDLEIIENLELLESLEFLEEDTALLDNYDVINDLGELGVKDEPKEQ